MKKQAFTLAEVLLVVGIIGVIAAVTIPAVTTSNQNKKFTALTKKAQATLQGAIDNKMGYTLSRPGNFLFRWLVDGEEVNHNTIKFVERDDANEILTTPDGMVFLADGNRVGNGRLRYEGKVFVDLNGAEGPSRTTVDNVDNMDDAGVDDANNFDIVVFEITRNGDVIAEHEKTRQYLELGD